MEQRYPCPRIKIFKAYRIDQINGRRTEKPLDQLISFGRYVLHLSPLKVTEGRRVLRLSPRQLAVLAMIVKAEGAVISKEAFLEAIWQDSFVEDGNLTQTIFLTRRALGKLPDGGEYIETIPRRGYRLASNALSRPDGHAPNSATFPVPDVTGEEQFRLLVECIEDYAIYMLDCAGRVATWNSGSEKNKGYTKEEVLGQHFSIFFVPEDVESKVPDRELSVAAQKGKVAGEGWRMRKSGERFWAGFAITAMRDVDGKLIGYAKVVHDLTEYKRQDDALRRMDAAIRRERDTLHAAAESSMDALYICEAVRNLDGEIEDFVFTYLNRNVEKMVAIPRDRLLRGKMCELFPVNRTQGLFDEYKRVVMTGVPFVAEFPISAPDITCEWIRIRALSIGDGVAITASDISERKRAEAKIASLLEKSPNVS